MPRFKITLEYDGTAFHGWQSQTNAANVQDTLAAALKVLFKQDVRVDGASRTDAGVHARGQVAAFSVETDKEAEKIRFGLNGILPRSVQVRRIETTAEVFDPRRDPLSKTYRYTWIDGPTMPPFWRHWAWYSHHRLDAERMHAALARAAQRRHDADHGPVLVVSHGGSIRALLARSTGAMPPPLENVAVFRAVFDGDALTEVALLTAPGGAADTRS